MKPSSIKSNAMLAALALCVYSASAEPATLTVRTDQTGAAINRGMWGIFFEDINLGADGGLYAELVKNRSFEFPDALMSWSIAGPDMKAGTISIMTKAPFDATNPHYLRIDAGNATEFGVSNEGFRGIGVKAGGKYDFSAQVRAVSGSPELAVRLVDSTGKILAEEKIKKLSAEWTLRKISLKPAATLQKSVLNILVVGGGVVEFDMVSLFPRDTWKHRPGGLRADMVQLLAEMKPGFMRFPGGCIVEGHTLTNRYQWKTTLGPIAERKLIMNRWNDEFKHRPTPDYYQTFGLGFFEYFQLCEDIGAEPLPILSCGLACQFNTGEACPLDQLDPYIQDALDLIEFANGPTNSTWGAKRATLGHPAPFHLKMLGVGNENWQQPYLERYARFHAALKDKYPEIKLVSSAGPGPDGNHFDYAWPRLRELNADIVDEHCYAKPDWFYNNSHRYDNYDRNGPIVFFGEYAAQSDKIVSVDNRNNLDCALSEAACMTGLERNGDVVQMASYAPLFAHVEGWQWKPDLIWVNNLQSYGTPNYYVQKLFANNPGDMTVPLKLDSATGEKLFASATRDNASGELILKVVNGDSKPAEVKLDLVGAKNGTRKITVSTLTSGSVQDENSFAAPEKVFPKETKFKITAPQFSYIFPANSLTVFRLKISK